MVKVENKKNRKSRKKGHADCDSSIDTVIKIVQNNTKTKQRKENIKLEKDRKRKKFRRKIIAKIILFLTLAAIIIGAIVLCLTSPKFNINKIVVKGQKKVLEKDILELSEIKIGSNIFTFSKKKVCDKLETNPYIKDAVIKKKYPNIVEIEILERKEKYSIKMKEDYLYISENGYMLGNSQNELGLFVIEGMSQEVKLNSQITKENLKLLYNISLIKLAANNYEIEKLISRIDVADKNNYHLYIKEKGKDIYFGNEENINTKMMYIVSIMEKNEGIEGTIYVNGDFNNNYKPYFRKKI